VTDTWAEICWQGGLTLGLIIGGVLGWLMAYLTMVIPRNKVIEHLAKYSEWGQLGGDR
jgi:hypothetical protein